MKTLDKDTLLYICEVLYSEGIGNRKGGATVVYDLANSLAIEDRYSILWNYCEPCDTQTPHLPDQHECLVCGSLYETEKESTT